jgi:hypothetical protein
MGFMVQRLGTTAIGASPFIQFFCKIEISNFESIKSEAESMP